MSRAIADRPPAAPRLRGAGRRACSARPRARARPPLPLARPPRGCAAGSARRVARDPRETRAAGTGTGARARSHRILRRMSDASKAVKGLKERLSDGTEDRLGKALTDLLENPVLTGVVGAAFDARERAAQAQEVAMGAFNIPSAADIERLTRRLRSVSQRLEGIEDGVYRLDRALSGRRGRCRLSAIEDQLGALASKLGQAAKRAAKPAATAKPAAKAKPASKAKPAGKAKPASKVKAKPAAKAKWLRRRNRPKPNPQARQNRPGVEIRHAAPSSFARGGAKARQRPRGPRGAGGSSHRMGWVAASRERGDGHAPSPRPRRAADVVVDARARAGALERVGDGQHASDGHRRAGADARTARRPPSRSRARRRGAGGRAES